MSRSVSECLGRTNLSMLPGFWTSNNMDGYYFPIPSVVTFQSNGNIGRRRMCVEISMQHLYIPILAVRELEGWKVGRLEVSRGAQRTHS